MTVSPDKLRRFLRKRGKRPLVLAHRGARRDAPENTLLAFETALNQGADGVELDVRMSADGELIVHHDEEVRTAKGAHVALGKLSGSQIRALRTESGEPVPTLREVLLFGARTGALLNVELKADVRAPLFMAREAARQICVHGGDGVLLSSFSPAQVWLLSRCLPELPVALLLHEEQTVLPHLLPLALLGAVGVHAQLEMLSDELLVRARRAGALFNVWTVNKPSDAVRLAQQGVDALITDVPALVLPALSA